jgi:hypothetical protein
MRIQALFFALFLSFFARAQPIYPDLKTKKFGIYDPVMSEPITANEFDNATVIPGHDSLATVEKNGRVGVLSVSGRTVVPLDFDKIDASSIYYEPIFITVWRGEKCGKWNLKTGRSVLPTEFEYVRGLFPDLIATRRTSVEIIEFFDEKGKKRFETVGKTAAPLFDGSAIEVLNAAGERSFLDKKGQPVFFGKTKNGIWTDGQFVIILEPKKDSPKDRFALLSIAGDTILPLSTHQIQPQGKGRFFVKSVERDRNQGFFDAISQQWIFPLSKAELFKFGEKGDPEGVIFVSKMGYDKPGNHLYDSAGKLLVENCQTNTLYATSFSTQGSDEYRPFRYIECKKVEKTTSKGFFASDGRMIVPMEFDLFWYRSETHAVIAKRNFPNTQNVMQANAFDLKTGQKWFAEDFEDLYFTADPARFWAKKGKRWGLVERSRPASAKFDFDQFVSLSNGFFQLAKNGKWQLFDPKGKPTSNRFFDAMMQPDYQYHRQFQASKKSKGKLVAFCLDYTKKDGWWAIDDRKKHFFMEYKHDEMPDIDMKSEEH